MYKYIHIYFNIHLGVREEVTEDTEENVPFSHFKRKREMK